jgi:hypothetical protein
MSLSEPLPNLKYKSVTGAATLSAEFNCFLLSGTATFTIPTQAAAGWRQGTTLWLKSISGTATIASADTVASGYTTLTVGQACQLVYVTESGWVGLVKPQ